MKKVIEEWRNQMRRMNGLIDMTGFGMTLCLIMIIAVFWLKESRLLHKMHKPLTVFLGVLAIIHAAASFTAVMVIDRNMLLIIISGLLAVMGFIAGILVLLKKRKSKELAVKLHIIYSFLSAGFSVIHIILSETLQ